MNINDLTNTKIDMRDVLQLDGDNHLVKMHSSDEDANFMSAIAVLNMAQSMKDISLRYAEAHNNLVQHIEREIPDKPYEDHMHKVQTFNYRGSVWVRLHDRYMWAEGTSGMSEFGSVPIAMDAIRKAVLR